MSDTSSFEKRSLQAMPNAFTAITKLIMAMAGVTKDSGKKTLFGKDKGEKAFSKFLAILKEALDAMTTDGVIQSSTPTEEVIEIIESKLKEFSTAYPDWEDGYSFAANFFGDQRKAAITAITKLRLMR